MSINLSDTVSYTFIPNYANLENYGSQILIGANFLYGSINTSNASAMSTLDYCRYDININNSICTIYTKFNSLNNLFIGFDEDFTYSDLIQSGFTLQLQTHFTRTGDNVHLYHYYNINEDDNFIGGTDLIIDTSQWFTYNGAYASVNPFYINFKLVPTSSYLNRIFSSSYDSAFNEGYNSGYFDGTSESSSPINNGFGLVGHLFDSVGGLLNHEIMPNFTIGGIISIPIVLTAIIVIIKAVK